MGEKSYKQITRTDLKKLQKLALDEEIKFFRRNPKHLNHKDSLIAIALCQGAALHFVNRKAGIKDFDIFYFYPSFWVRRGKSIDSALSKFGVHPDDAKNGYEGRRIDFFRRKVGANISEKNRKDPILCIIGYLRAENTDTAKKIAQKAVVGLWPKEIFGKVLWSKHRKRTER